MTRYYRIAGLTVQMDAGGRTEAQARPYLTDPAPADIVIAADPRPLQEAQPHLSPDDCEYLATGGDFYRQLLEHDGLLIHASAVVMDGAAYLFSGPCGTGKSTHTRLWQQVFGSHRAQILNDDKPAVRLEDGVWYAYGTPWSGKTDQNLNLRVPLAGVCFLRQGQSNEIAPLTGGPAVFALLEQTARPRGESIRTRLLELADRLLTRVPVWQMSCNMEPDAPVTSYTAMSAAMKGANPP